MAKANRLIEIPNRLFQLPVTYARLERGYLIWSACLEWQGLLSFNTCSKLQK